MTDEPESTPPPIAAPPPEEEAYEVSVQDRPAWHNQLRAAVGLRPLPPRIIHTLRVAPPVDLDAPGALRRGLWWTFAGLCFAALVVVAFTAYGVRARARSLGEAVQGGDAVREALERASRGDLSAARRFVGQSSAELRGSVTLDFVEGYLQGRDPAAQANPPEVPARGPRQRIARALARRAGYETGKGEYEAALESLRRATQAAPQHPGVGILLAAAYMDAGQPREAVSEIDRLERLGGANETLCRFRGWAYLKLGDLDGAEAEFRAGLVLSPSSAVMYQGLAEVANARGNHGAAMEAAEQAQRLAPTSPDARFVIATTHQLMGDWRRAVSGYRVVLAMDPQHVHSLNNLAYLLAVHAGELREALALAEQALELAPHAPDVLDTVGWVRHLSGDNAGALPLLREAHGSQPGNPEMQLHLGVVLVALGKRGEAAPLLKQAAGPGVPAGVRSEAQRELGKLRGAGG